MHRVIHLPLRGNGGAIFSQWLGPLRDMNASTVSSRIAGGADHLSFDTVGSRGIAIAQTLAGTSTAGNARYQGREVELKRQLFRSLSPTFETGGKG